MQVVSWYDPLNKISQWQIGVLLPVAVNKTYVPFCCKNKQMSNLNSCYVSYTPSHEQQRCQVAAGTVLGYTK